MGFVDMASENQTVKLESTRLVNQVLPLVAKAIYKAMIVVWVDINKFEEK